MRNCFLAIAAIGLAALLAPAAAADDGIEIGFMNGVHEDLDANLRPIRQGSITIRVSSPDHRLTVHGNRLTLEPRSDGTLEAKIEVDFEGRGHLIADVESVGRFEDQVQAPRQTARTDGIVRLTRAGDGYVFTVERADRSVPLEIDSGVARQVVSACRMVAVFLNLPCQSIESALSVIRVPMPGEGEQIQVPASLLSDDEKAYLDRFVADE